MNNEQWYFKGKLKRLNRKIDATNETNDLGVDAPRRRADGHSVDNDDMHWVVSCPECERELEYSGYFDSGDTNKCECGTEFQTRRVYFDDGSYIE